MFPVVPAAMDLPAALDRVEAAFAPADDAMIAAAVGECAALTAPRNGESADVVLRAYLSRLKGWPADVVLTVLREWPKRSKWFPTWQELESALDAATQPRRDLKAAIEWTMARGPDEPAKPMQPPTDRKASPVADLTPQPAAPIRTREEQLAVLNAMATGA